VTWHQDEAFWPAEYEYRSIAAWLPMHDVPVEMGAMQFIPGSHRGGVLRHRHEDDVAQGLLTLDEEVDLSTAVACPLKKGGCTFHHPSTLHYTAPNATDRPRLAYPLTVQGLPVRRPVPRPTPWMDEFYAVTGGKRQAHYVADGQVLPLPE
jgi:ectoine hydroxylase-related dioxygenase (phytanoyl-CoA dioxygenase family)